MADLDRIWSYLHILIVLIKLSTIIIVGSFEANSVNLPPLPQMADVATFTSSLGVANDEVFSPELAWLERASPTNTTIEFTYQPQNWNLFWQWIKIYDPTLLTRWDISIFIVARVFGLKVWKCYRYQWNQVYDVISFVVPVAIFGISSFDQEDLTSQRPWNGMRYLSMEKYLGIARILHDIYVIGLYDWRDKQRQCLAHDYMIDENQLAVYIVSFGIHVLQGCTNVWMRIILACLCLMILGIAATYMTVLSICVVTASKRGFHSTWLGENTSFFSVISCQLTKMIILSTLSRNHLGHIEEFLGANGGADFCSKNKWTTDNIWKYIHSLRSNPFRQIQTLDVYGLWETSKNADGHADSLDQDARSVESSQGEEASLLMVTLGDHTTGDSDLIASSEPQDLGSNTGVRRPEPHMPDSRDLPDVRRGRTRHRTAKSKKDRKTRMRNHSFKPQNRKPFDQLGANNFENQSGFEITLADRPMRDGNSTKNTGRKRRESLSQEKVFGSTTIEKNDTRTGKRKLTTRNLSRVVAADEAHINREMGTINGSSGSPDNMHHHHNESTSTDTNNIDFIGRQSSTPKLSYTIDFHRTTRTRTRSSSLPNINGRQHAEYNTKCENNAWIDRGRSTSRKLPSADKTDINRTKSRSFTSVSMEEMESFSNIIGDCNVTGDERHLAALSQEHDESLPLAVTNDLRQQEWFNRINSHHEDSDNDIPILDRILALSPSSENHDDSSAEPVSGRNVETNELGVEPTASRAEVSRRADGTSTFDLSSHDIIGPIPIRPGLEFNDISPGALGRLFYNLCTKHQGLPYYHPSSGQFIPGSSDIEYSFEMVPSYDTVRYFNQKPWRHEFMDIPREIIPAIKMPPMQRSSFLLFYNDTEVPVPDTLGSDEEDDELRSLIDDTSDDDEELIGKHLRPQISTNTENTFNNSIFNISQSLDLERRILPNFVKDQHRARATTCDNINLDENELTRTSVKVDSMGSYNQTEQEGSSSSNEEHSWGMLDRAEGGISFTADICKITDTIQITNTSIGESKSITSLSFKKQNNRFEMNNIPAGISLVSLRREAVSLPVPELGTSPSFSSGTESEKLGNMSACKASEVVVVSELRVDKASEVDVESEPRVDKALDADVESELRVDKALDVVSELCVDKASDIVSELRVDKASEVNVVSELRVDKASEADAVSELRVDNAPEAEALSGLWVDKASEADVMADLRVDKASELDVMSELRVDKVSELDAKSVMRDAKTSEANVVPVVRVPSSQLATSSDLPWINSLNIYDVITNEPVDQRNAIDYLHRIASVIADTDTILLTEVEKRITYHKTMLRQQQNHSQNHISSLPSEGATTPTQRSSFFGKLRGTFRTLRDRICSRT